MWVKITNVKFDFTYLAFVSFSKPEEGLAACTGIDHSFVMNNEVVSMKADLKSSVMIPKLIYAKYDFVFTIFNIFFNLSTNALLICL
jgi:hypothetical protein